MDKANKAFVSDNLPEFITSGNPTFKLFLEAYYEFLEKSPDSESSNVKEMFRALDGPSSLINNSTAIKDIDTTLDLFIDYFRKQVIPVSIDLAKTDKRIVLKKIRDVYLAKGTSKSFDLLFKLIYDEQIDIFETRDNIIEASEGKYLSFPLATFRVVSNESLLPDMNFSLASLKHSDDSYVTDSDIAIVLSASVIGKTADSDINKVISVQLNITTSFDDSQIYRIVDATDDRKYVDIKPMLTLQDLIAKNNAPGYVDGDLIKITSRSLKKSFNVIVDSVLNGPVTGLHFRDRGEFFSVGDSFSFSPDSPGDGAGGGAVITEVDRHGRITKVDGFNVRTGSQNNGLLADDLENVIVPILNGGSYNKIPDVTINTVTVKNQGLPYAQTGTTGIGAIVAPVSTKIGTIAKLNFFDRGFFVNANDVIIQAPMNVIVEDDALMDKGQIVSFQYLLQKNDSFFSDSDRIDLSLKINKTVSVSDSEPGGPTTRYNLRTIRLPHAFDSELFEWHDSDYVIDSEQGLSVLTNTYVNRLKHFNHEIIDDSDTGFKIRLSNKFIHRLDNFHFSKLNNYKFNDSDYSFNWRIDYRNPRLGIDSEVAEWTNTGFFGLVNRVSSTKKSISITPVSSKPFPSDSDLNEFDNVKNTILRIAAYSNSTESVIVRNDLEIQNIIAFHARAEYDPVLNSSGQTAKTFINEDGFLNSLSGGVIQDNFLYSNYTYIIQSALNIRDWRELVKTTLHPAGMIMLAEKNINSQLIVPHNIVPTTKIYKDDTKFTFDTMLDHYSDPRAENFISADNTRYEANALLYYYQTNTNLNALLASNFTRGFNVSLADEFGASWWDFEPLGLVRKEQVNYDGFYNNFLLFDSDSLLRHVTTQDSDGSGYVAPLIVNFKKYNGSAQDLYKRESRSRRSYDPIQIISTKFVDPINDLYTHYDSDLPLGFHLRFSDSESNTYKAIDYGRLKSINDSRTFKWYTTDRKRELMYKNAIDFNKAMRLDGSLTFVSNGVEYKDFDAYEQIWNTINSKRLDSEGWEINGFASFIQNLKRKPRLLYTKYAAPRTPDFRKIKTPFKKLVWDKTNDSDNIIYNTHYVTNDDSVLNSTKGNIFDFNFSEPNPNAEDFRDPHNSMKSRKQ
tara:strand:- start:8138 stop:11515 length:3378 start_codon:yes stop_codon:yes gene_type:complete